MVSDVGVEENSAHILMRLKPREIYNKRNDLQNIICAIDTFGLDVCRELLQGKKNNWLSFGWMNREENKRREESKNSFA